MSTIRSGYRYSEDHEWLDTSASPARVGISAVAAEELGDVVHLELPEVGAEVTAGEPCGEVESTKSVADIYAPVSGTVVEINDAVLDDPAVVNEDPYGAGWLFSVEVSTEGSLLTAEEYAEKNGGELT
ncbi:glycine cleavage system protein GcvH [Raineyella fluvialis]|uniref:Glycine cleavage system H protein n=1 Tax=Raineyella fluvialis TaxID=2662261 RepID=A0A5Q2FA45_9ACTN|nr:glycine cleavage system protein GcvH [Raineyella fluvialis]QGF23251.1 glycine cleavage system protein GcvH [Raineyella fluvialis]